MIQINILSMIMGGSIVGLLWAITLFITWIMNRRIKHTLPAMKNLIEETYNHLQKAADNQKKLYDVFLEIENGI